MAQSKTSEKEKNALSSSIRNVGAHASDWIRSFRLIYLAVFVFIILYITTVRVAEFMLDDHFQAVADQSITITNLERPIALQIKQNMEKNVSESNWVVYGGVKVNSLILGSDGITWIYVQGQIEPQPDGLPPTDVLRQAVELLPATASVSVTVPHNSLLANAILIAYASILLWGLYLNLSLIHI